MVELNDIIAAYRTARANKRRTSDQTDFELHWEKGCLRLCREINQRCLRPTAYTFVTTRPRPREVFASDMATRVLHHYIDIRLRPLLEKRLSDHTYNNRLGRGQKACQNAVISDIYEMSNGFAQDAYIIKLDLRGCFPNIVQDIAYNQLREVIEQDYKGSDKDDLLYMLRCVIFSNPTEHCRKVSGMEAWNEIEPSKSLFTKPAGIGAAIGFLIWQVAVNWYFHELDAYLESNPEIRFERFVDDIYIVARSKDALLLIPEIRERLSAIGARLNEHKFYCQHWSKGAECLGVHIKGARVYLNTRVVNNAVRAARHTGRASDTSIERVLSSLNSYLGMAKQTCGYNQITKIVNALPKGWAEYMKLNPRRMVLTAKRGHAYRERYARKFNLIPKRYGCKDTTPTLGGKAA